MLLHRVAWLGAVLWADPQRLILKAPWYLDVALAFGATAPRVWVYLAFPTGSILIRTPHSWADRLSGVLTALALGLYLPFITYWQITAPPVW